MVYRKDYNKDKGLQIILNGLITLLTDYRTKQVQRQPMEIIVPKRNVAPPIINITVPEPQLPQIVFSIPGATKETRQVINVQIPKQSPPIINVNVPDAKLPVRSTETKMVQRDANGNMVGTRAVTDYEYNE